MKLCFSRFRKFFFFSLFLSFTFYLSCISGSIEDKIPPGTVNDLSASYIDFYGFEIMFTSPGDDLFTGTANRFDIRYSTSDDFFTAPEKNFEFLGVQVPEVPSPPPAGQKVKFFIRNLDPKTKYYAALRTYDEAGNFSDVSNVVEVITSDVPGGSGELIGRIELPFYFQKIVSDGENIYLLFPGLYKVERVGNSFNISPLNTNIPYIVGSQVVWDGEKFISIGGNIGGVFVGAEIGIYPHGNTPAFPLVNEGEIIPFGTNGFFGYGVMNHKVVKFQDGFLVLGGIKYFSQTLDDALKEDKFTKLGSEKIAFFKTSGTKILWKVLYPSSSTTPFSIVNPSVVPLDDGNIVLWGGSRSDVFVEPSRDMFLLKSVGDTQNNSNGENIKLIWNLYVPFSGKLYKVMNSCEAEGTVKILRVKEVKVEGQEVKFSSIEDANPGDIISVDDKTYEVDKIDFIKKFFIIGRFRYGDTEFPAILSFFQIEDKGILVKLKPLFRGEEWIPPELSYPCSALYFKDTLFILYFNNLYVIKYRSYEIYTSK